MKILFISHSSRLYGAPKSLLYLVEDLVKRYDIKPIVLTPDYGGLTTELDKLDIKYIVTKFKQSGIKVKTNPITTDQYPTAATRPMNSKMSKAKLEANGFKLFQHGKKH